MKLLLHFKWKFFKNKNLLPSSLPYENLHMINNSWNVPFLKEFLPLLAFSSIILVTVRWFSLGTQDSSTNKTDHHDITEILLKVALNTINQTKPSITICGGDFLFVSKIILNVFRKKEEKV
jgi:hypothetical protein